jgi:hypothetical protein
MPLNRREILEEVQNGTASLEPAPSVKEYCRLVIHLPENSKATITQYQKAIQKAV